MLAGNQKGFARGVKKSGISRDEIFICGSVVSNLVQAGRVSKQSSSATFAHSRVVLCWWARPEDFEDANLGLRNETGGLARPYASRFRLVSAKVSYYKEGLCEEFGSHG